MKLVITIEFKRSRRKAVAEQNIDATGFTPWYYVEPEEIEEEEEEFCPAGVNVASAALNRAGLGSSPRRGTQYLKEHVAFERLMPL